MSMHKPKKKFGQNFLNDKNIIDKIVSTIAPQNAQLVIEIGPGQGAITEKLIERTEQLVCVELDRDLYQILQDKYQQRIQLVQADALALDFTPWLQSNHNAIICGNLPYNISTPLLFHFLRYVTHIEKMIFMLQKEVVDRITAKPGTKEYGRLSVMIQYHCQTMKCFEVSKHCFFPKPKVESAIVQLVPFKHDKPCVAKDEKKLAKVVATLFAQRRKTIRNNLKSIIPADKLEDLNIPLQVRAENLSVSQIVEISNIMNDLI